MASHYKHLVISVIAYDKKVCKEKYWEKVRQAQHEMDRANTERDDEHTYITVTVDDIVRLGLMNLSECQPYNSIQTALSLYETCGGNATIVVMDADLVVTQMASTEEIIKAAAYMERKEDSQWDPKVICTVYAEKYNTCNTGYIIFPAKRRTLELQMDSRAKALTAYEERQGALLELSLIHI